MNSDFDNETLSAEYDKFGEQFESLTGIKLSLYKEKQMKRRILTLIERKKFDGFESYFEKLRTAPGELKAFLEYITINVTEFFRTSDQWKSFEEVVLSDLAGRKNGKLKIWSAACSTGEEAYSLAMSMLSIPGFPDFEIIATDIDDSVLQKGIEGIYDEKSISTLPDEIRDKFFVPDKGTLKVSEEVKKHVIFRHLDLLRDEYPRDCDLIVCRNVLIYFKEEGKDLIYNKFRESLKPGGFLFTGNAEQIVYYKSYGFRKIKNFIYQTATSD